MEEHPFIEYNYTKHHLNYLQGRIDFWRSFPPENLRLELRKAGDNLLDLYTGRLSVREVLDQCDNYLKQEKLYEKGRFNLIMGKEGYRKVRITDKSEWIFRKNDQPDKFAHVHPARYSNHTLRIKAATLKTVVALLILNSDATPEWQPDLEIVNRTREEILDLSPVKSLSANTGILRLLGIFSTTRPLPK